MNSSAAKQNLSPLRENEDLLQKPGSRFATVEHSYTPEARYGRLLGKSPRIIEVYHAIEMAAKVEVPVLIIGETGTGKELVAQEVHERSRRKEGPFVAVHMGALSQDLVASELFGHVKGAFTGATDSKIGCYESADGGTLFLDEIGTMEERTQVMLLRLLETGSFRPVGSQQDKHADVRIVAATNVELHEAVINHKFREDLLHRFEVFPIKVPPLRERLEDLPALVRHFIDLAREEMSCPVSGISPGAMEMLRHYSWPGNLRELKNVIAHAAVLAEGGQITENYLPERVRTPSSPAMSTAPARPEAQQSANPAPAPDTGEEHGISRSGEGLYVPVGCSLDDMQKAYVLLTLERCDNNKTQAARMLGLSRKTLYERLRRWKVRV